MAAQVFAFLFKICGFQGAKREEENKGTKTVLILKHRKLGERALIIQIHHPKDSSIYFLTHFDSPASTFVDSNFVCLRWEAVC